MVRDDRCFEYGEHILPHKWHPPENKMTIGNDFSNINNQKREATGLNVTSDTGNPFIMQSHKPSWYDLNTTLAVLKDDNMDQSDE